MVAVGNGAQAKIESQVAALGQNLLIVFAGNRKSGGVNSGLGSASSLTLADATAIAREVADVVAISPEISTNAQAIANGRNWSTSILGESPGYIQIRDWKLSDGAMFTDREVRAASQGRRHRTQDRESTFRPDQSHGPDRALKNIPFVIIGVLDEQRRRDGRQRPGRPHHHSLHDRHEAPDRRQNTALAQCPNRQRRTHEIRPGADHQPAAPAPPHCRTGSDNDFNILNQKEIADTVGTISRSHHAHARRPSPACHWSSAASAS